MQPETVDDEAAVLLMTVLDLNIYQRKPITIQSIAWKK